MAELVPEHWIYPSRPVVHVEDVPIIFAAELDRLADDIHDQGALKTRTALDVETYLRGRAAELRAETATRPELEN